MIASGHSTTVHISVSVHIGSVPGDVFGVCFIFLGFDLQSSLSVLKCTLCLRDSVRSEIKGQIFSTLAQISTSLDIQHRAKRASANHRRSQLKVPLFLLPIAH